ncbi:hypothetical protein [Kitasatospora sp. NPDC086791]|uniref:hypothetical protein n=1 Tax=Kitasatospora sp. NPDC086791 TaxID=3155178 RepID=UPI00342B29EA
MITTAPRGNRALRTAAILLIPAGLLLHLWLGTKGPLLAVAVGLACHLAAALAARRRFAARRRTHTPHG